MASKEGEQLDTFPSQLYGIYNGLPKKIAVSADGKLEIEGGGLPTTGLDTNDVPMWNGSEWVYVPAGTTFSFSIASFSDGESATQLVGSGEWRAIGALSFTASYTNGPATAAYIAKSGWSNLTLLTPFTSGTSEEAVDYPTAGNSVSFTLHASKSAESATSTQTVSFYNLFYWGGSTTASSYSEADVEGLDESLLSNDPTQTWAAITLDVSEYFIFAMPSRLTTPLFYDNDTGFEFAMEAPETVSITNSSGYTEDYKVFRSENILGPGTITLRTT